MRVIEKKHDGLAVVLSWPETVCKQAGAWYEPLMKWLGVNKDGYYKVGHSAIVLIDDQNRRCQYFDFGRYHAPAGFGRIRDEFTDHDLSIATKADIGKNGDLINTKEIINELYRNESCHGVGHIFASVVRVNVGSAMGRVNKMKERDFIPYGPLVWNGSNCSRFVASVLNHSGLSLAKRLKLNLQYTVSASPKGNVQAVSNKRIIVGVSPQLVNDPMKEIKNMIPS